jgi:DNA topoisomerase-1
MENKKYKLLIVESPAKAKSIQGYLKDKNFKCIASKGHILELPKKDLGIDLDTFEISLVPISDKKDLISEIKKLAKDAEEIYLGPDPDREGGGIAAHLRDIVRSSKKPIHRVLFHEITKSAIEKALASPTKIDEKQYEAQKTRRILDRLVGYKISPILWEKLGPGLSAGRVQSSALRLIVDREKEIESFIPERYFQITAKLKKDDITFESKYFGEAQDKKTELTEEDFAKKVYNEILDKDFLAIKIDKKEKKQNPSAPFTTSRLQQEASNKLRFQSKKTMEIAQRLYDGSISLGEKGGQGLITYMRTDSVRVNSDFQEKTKSFIIDKYGNEYAPKEFNSFKSKNANSQDAHEAIRPTNLEYDPESIRKNLSDDEYSLYKLIWNKYLASQMESAVLDTSSVVFDVSGHFFKSNGSVIKFDGFRKVYLDEDEKKKDEDDNGSLPDISKNDSISPIEKPKLSEKFTLPPPRYTEASLIKTLEELGIGRPSTYSAIISNISDRKYVEKSENKFLPTGLGLKLSDFLVNHFVRESDYEFTAKMESQLDEIESGDLDYIKVLKEFWAGLSETIEKKKVEIESIKKEPFLNRINEKNKSGISCDCGGELIIKKSKTGDFLGCINYPTCKNTKSFKKNKKGEIKIQEKTVEYYKEPCSDCGKRMRLIDGKFGKFYSCEGYKEGCKKTAPFTTDVPCPDCGVGFFMRKISIKTKNEFYGCSNYPNCKNIVQSEPINKPCSKCNYSVVSIKKIDGRDELFCKKCK